MTATAARLTPLIDEEGNEEAQTLEPLRVTPAADAPVALRSVVAHLP
jgi:hypothetical protein